MIRRRTVCRAGLLVAVVTRAALSQASADSGAVPRFHVDPFWPKELPHNWIIGQVSGVAVDARDHVWVLHRPRTLTAREAGAVQKPPLSECCVPAPPVIEFDEDGNVVNAWGGPGAGYDWPENEHTIYIDPNGSVWIASNGPSDGMVLKFSREGRFVLQIGKRALSNGSNDVTSLGGPAGIDVDAAANEVYIADGYKNRRVIVFDASTGAYKRHWGAYGGRPVDGDTAAYDPAAPPSRNFGYPVHALRISRDGLVYVADRVNNRIQVFRKNGAFVKEAFLARATLAMGSVWDIAFSRDPTQAWVYVPDGTNQKVWILRRSDLSVAGSFGRGGRWAGQFGWVHNAAVDSRGNIYATEVDIYKRVQKFVRR
jgi:DNA-binding beta-propeller fold protein YncE